MNVNHYHVLYRNCVDYPYLAILYPDFIGSAKSATPLIYAFNEQSEIEIMTEKHTPTIVNNNHGNGVHQNYIDLGWMDITHAKDLLPLSIQMWLTRKSS